MPTLSIVMPTYDDEKYLPTSIEAILNQSFPDFELIVVNDASPDNSDAIIKEYASRDHRIIYVKNEENLGTIKSCNRGCEIASGDYMYHASSDDKVFPSFFEEAMFYLLKHPEIPMCTSDCAYFDDGDEGWLKVNRLLPLVTKAKTFSVNETMHLYQTTRFSIYGHSTIFKRAEGEKRGFLCDSLGYICDFVLYNSIALTGGIIYIPKPLAGMRLFPKANKIERERAIENTDNWVTYVKKEQRLWDIFFKSTLIARAIPSKFFTIFLKPKHWDIVIPLSWMKFTLFVKKVFKRLTTTWITVKN